VTLLRVAVTAGLLLTFAGCGTTSSRDAPDATRSLTAAVTPARLVDPAEFAGEVDSGRRFVVNVHVPFEGDIAGTDVAIPFDRIRADAGLLPKDRSTPLALYCRSGTMSAIAATDLAGLGYTDIVELDGGMNAWTEAGLPLSRTPAT